MNQNPSNLHKKDAERYLDEAQAKYQFVFSGGVYVADTYEDESETCEQKPGSNPRFPFFTEPKEGNLTRTISILTLILLCCTACFTGRQLPLSRDSANAARQSADASAKTYEATVRPYVFSVGIQAQVTSGQVIDGVKRPELTYIATFQNFGPVPADTMTDEWKTFLGGVQVKPTFFDNSPGPMPPNHAFHMIGHIGSNDGPSVIAGIKSMIVYTAVHYTWRDKQEYGCTKYLYNALTQSFMNLGPRCYPD